MLINPPPMQAAVDEIDFLKKTKKLSDMWTRWLSQVYSYLKILSTSSTVAQLPVATTAYQRSFVTDANVTTFNSIVAGGGANIVPVFSDGTNWRIG